MGMQGHAQTGRARYLVGGCEQVRQAGTQKRAPVQRRGPHTVRRRKSREQVNQTSEEKTEDDVAGMLRNRQKWGALQTTPLHLVSPLGQQHPTKSPVQPTRRGREELAPREFGGGVERSQGIPVLTLALFLTSLGLN